MKKPMANFVLRFLSTALLVSVFNISFAQTYNKSDSRNNTPFSSLRQTSCDVDTIDYVWAKTDTINSRAIGLGETSTKLGQKYHPLQTVDVHGFYFYAYMVSDYDGVDSLKAKIHTLGPDGFPDTALDSVMVPIDTTIGLIRYADFSTPVTVSDSFVITVDATTDSVTRVYCNQNGRGDYHGIVYIPALSGWLTITNDWDVLLMPFVSYEINSDFSSDAPACHDDTISFTYASSPIMLSRAFNRYAWDTLPAYPRPGDTIAIAPSPSKAAVSDQPWPMFPEQPNPGVPHNWRFGDGNTSTNQHPAHPYGDFGIYTVTLRDSLRGWRSTCVDMAQEDVYSLPLIEMAVTDTLMCLDDNIQLGASGGEDYAWTPATGLSDPNIANPVFTPPDTGDFVFTLTLTDTLGCEIDSTVDVRVIDVPRARFSFKQTDDAVEFTSESIHAFNHFWDFDDGLSTETHPEHVYSSPGTYQVQLAVDNVCGVDTAFQSITVHIEVIPGGGPQVRLYPNPASQYVYLVFEAASMQPIHISLISVQGSIQREYRVAPVQAGEKIRLPMQDLPTGTYFLRMLYDNHLTHKSVIIQR